MVAQCVGWLLSQFIAVPEESDWIIVKKRPRPLSLLINPSIISAKSLIILNPQILRVKAQKTYEYVPITCSIRLGNCSCVALTSPSMAKHELSIFDLSP